MKKGFTIAELLVFMSIFSLIIVAFITMLVAFINLQTNQSASAEVSQQSQFLLQQIQYYVESARLIDMRQDVPSGGLIVREFVQAQDPTLISLSNGTVYLQQSLSGSLQPLTSNKVTVSNLSFTRHYNLNTSSAPFGTDSVSFSFTMQATSTNNTPYSESFQSSAQTFVLVGKIARVQQTGVANNAPSVTNLGLAYPANNESSSLLIAVVANTTSSASVALSDTAGNTWTQIASTSYPAYNTKLSVFAALNVKSGANTVSTTFTGSAGYASLLLFEYRGAATSSSFDASSTQLQPNNSNPSSGLANPTSSVELIFGVITSPGTAEVPSAGVGFSLDASSSVSHVFTEENMQYVTGPISAGWQYSGSPSSSVLVLTFK